MYEMYWWFAWNDDQSDIYKQLEVWDLESWFWGTPKSRIVCLIIVLIKCILGKPVNVIIFLTMIPFQIKLKVVNNI